ncbi:hypothetical protein [Moorena sp. SIO1F2]|nr:hypothetical protein [Moorena sp. SIO1F2]
MVRVYLGAIDVLEDHSKDYGLLILTLKTYHYRLIDILPALN